MKVDYSNNLPIYVQLVEDLKIKIISKEYNIGDSLPSVRELASIYKVNPNTMQKALTELENLGLIMTERTNGKFVTKNLKIIENFKKNYAKNICLQFLENLNSIGYDNEKAICLLEEFKKEK